MPPLDEPLATRFERLWDRNSEPPEPRDFLSGHPEATLRDRAEVIRVDQRRRWGRGEPRPLAEYFRAHPDVAALPAVRLALVVAEYKTACRHGRPPDRDAFLAEYPDLPGLREKLPAAAPVVAPTMDVPAPRGSSVLVEDAGVVIAPPSDTEVYGFAESEPDDVRADRADGDGLGGFLPLASDLDAAVSPLERPADPMADPVDPPPKPRQPPRNWAGRKLAERSKGWTADPSIGSLPWFWEWAAILATTRSGDWTKRQRSLMWAATWFNAACLAALVAVSAVGYKAWGFASFYRSMGEFGPEIAAADPETVRLYAEQLKAASLGAFDGRIRRLDAVDPSLRGWEWHHLRIPPVMPPVRPPDATELTALAFDGGGEKLAIAGPALVHGSSRGNEPKTRGVVWTMSLKDGTFTEVLSTDAPMARLVFSRDGARIAAVGRDGSVSVCDLAGGPPAVLPAAPPGGAGASSVVDAAFDPRSRKMLLVGPDGRVRSWEPGKGGDTRDVARGHEGAARLAVTPDGSRIAVAGRGEFALWDVTRDDPLARAGRPDAAVPVNLAVSPDGTLVAAVTADGLEVWKTADGTHVRQWSTVVAGNDRLAFDPSSRLLAVETPQGIRVWDVKDGKEAWFLKGGVDNNQVTAGVSFRADGLQLAARGLVWDLSDGKPAHDERNRGPAIFAPGGDDLVSFSGTSVLVTDPAQVLPMSALPVGGATSPDGRRIVTVLPGNHVIEVDSGKSLWHLGEIGARHFDVVAYRPDGRQFVSADREDEVRFWDAGSATPSLTRKLQSVVSMTYSADSKYLIAVLGPRRGFPEYAMLGVPRSVVFLDVQSGKPVRGLSGAYYQLGARVAISPDNRLIASGSVHNTVRIYDSLNGWLRRTFEGHTGPPVDVAFSPNGRLLASCCAADPNNIATPSAPPSPSRSAAPIKPPDGEVKLWDVASGGEVRTLPGAAFGVAFSPDGRRLAAAGRSEVTLWDVSTGIKLFVIPLESPNKPTKNLMNLQSMERFSSSLGAWALPIRFTGDGARLILTGRRFHERDWQQGDDLPDRTTTWRSAAAPADPP